MGKYSHAAATMSYETFEEWWGKLIVVLRTEPMPPQYDPNDFNGGSICRDGRAKAVAEVLGVPYGGKADQSWYFQKAIQF
jgi:hypothetical protein